jgi:NADP-dependent aldehyde dehydrogenase
MQLTGQQFLGFTQSKEGISKFHAVNPSTGEALPTDFIEATSGEIDAAIQKSENAFGAYRKKTGKEKAGFLDQIGEEIMALGDDLIQRCMKETGLPEARLQGERGRTVNQLKLFAELLREGSWVDARIDTAIPDRQPLPRPDIRQMKIAIGPVGVFGASNFPLAFSVAGGDTASALAAGCSVIVKAHPAHPGTSEMVASAIINAAKKRGMPDGVFSMVQGASVEVGMSIVNHSLIKAIGFTGSFKGGKAIYDAAVRRAEPIPVYAEMGSTNPVFILPRALKERGKEIAKGLVNSVTLGVGQFCTNPGVVVAIESNDRNKFVKETSELLTESNSGAMLTENIQKAFVAGINKFTATEGVSIIAKGKTAGSSCEGTAYLLQTTGQNFLNNQELSEEIFGPSTLAISAANKEELFAIAENLQGHLTATLICTGEDLEEFHSLVMILERKVGRLLINGFPTGVEVGHAMIHGGPFPATTDSRTTSVGTAAIYRFVRPVSYQDFPQQILPVELKNENRLGIWRFINGEFTKDKV